MNKLYRNAVGGRKWARGFSMIELLIALSITGTLLAATLTALDSSFKSYKLTTETASTHVVTRMVMSRVMAMIRTGTEFGPYPADVLDTTQNPVVSDAIEFTTWEEPTTLQRRIVRVERRAQADAERGPFELWYVETNLTAGVVTSTVERPLITGVLEARFTLEYSVGPRLRRATVDLTVRPNDFQDASFSNDLETPAIRLVSTVNPRRLD